MTREEAYWGTDYRKRLSENSKGLGASYRPFRRIRHVPPIKPVKSAFNATDSSYSSSIIQMAVDCCQGNRLAVRNCQSPTHRSFSVDSVARGTQLFEFHIPAPAPGSLGIDGHISGRPWLHESYLLKPDAGRECSKKPVCPITGVAA